MLILFSEKLVSWMLIIEEAYTFEWHQEIEVRPGFNSQHSL